MHHVIVYSEEAQSQARLLLYRVNRASLNRHADEEGCGAVFLVLFPPCGEAGE